MVQRYEKSGEEQNKRLRFLSTAGKTIYIECSFKPKSVIRLLRANTLSFCHLPRRFSITMEPHCALKAAGHLFKNKGCYHHNANDRYGLKKDSHHEKVMRSPLKGGEGLRRDSRQVRLMKASPLKGGEWLRRDSRQVRLMTASPLKGGEWLRRDSRQVRLMTARHGVMLVKCRFMLPNGRFGTMESALF